MRIVMSKVHPRARRVPRVRVRAREIAAVRSAACCGTCGAGGKCTEECKRVRRRVKMSECQVQFAYKNMSDLMLQDVSF